MILPSISSVRAYFIGSAFEDTSQMGHLLDCLCASNHLDLIYIAHGRTKSDQGIFLPWQKTGSDVIKLQSIPAPKDILYFMIFAAYLIEEYGVIGDSCPATQGIGRILQTKH